MTRLRKLSLACFLILTLRALDLVSAEEKESKTSEEAEKEESKSEIKEEDIAIDNGIYVLTESNFDSFLELHTTNGVLVEFYAPWCGHCKALTPEYEKAAKKLKQSNVDVPLAKIDGTIEMKLTQKYSIQGYPTLKFWKNGEPTDYDGQRDADGMFFKFLVAY